MLIKGKIDSIQSNQVNTRWTWQKESEIQLRFDKRPEETIRQNLINKIKRMMSILAKKKKNAR